MPRFNTNNNELIAYRGELKLIILEVDWLLWLTLIRPNLNQYFIDLNENVRVKDNHRVGKFMQQIL